MFNETSPDDQVTHAPPPTPTVTRLSDDSPDDGNAGDVRVLVRSVHGQLRGWLSDKYRRLDSRPLVDALADEARSAGAVPVDSVATETRVAIKVIVPQILEPIPGEFLVCGGEWSNSDFGNGTHSFRTFALRVICLLC